MTIRTIAAWTAISTTVGATLFSLHPVTAAAVGAFACLGALAGDASQQSLQEFAKIRDYKDESERFYILAGGLVIGSMASVALRALGIAATLPLGMNIAFLCTAFVIMELARSIFKSKRLAGLTGAIVGPALLGWAFSILTPASCGLFGAGVMAVAGISSQVLGAFFGKYPLLGLGWFLAIGAGPSLVCRTVLALSLKPALLLGLSPIVSAYACDYLARARILG